MIVGVGAKSLAALFPFSAIEVGDWLGVSFETVELAIVFPVMLLAIYIVYLIQKGTGTGVE
jgi:hypothetical protein